MSQQPPRIFDQLSGYELASLLHKASPVFAVGTGRCGSKFVAELISQFVPSVSAVHEMSPRLILENSDAEIQASNRLRRMLFSAAYVEKVVTLELDQKRLFSSSQLHVRYIEIMSSVFGNPVVIHLVRNPYDFIASGVKQGWFLNTTVWETSRSVYMVGEWRRRPQVVKLAIYWAMLNQYVVDMETLVPVHLLRIEDLVSSVEAADRVFDIVGPFCGDRNHLSEFIQNPVNSSGEWRIESANVFRNAGFRWSEVDKILRNEIAAIVKPMADRFGYDYQYAGD